MVKLVKFKNIELHHVFSIYLLRAISVNRFFFHEKNDNNFSKARCLQILFSKFSRERFSDTLRIILYTDQGDQKFSAPLPGRDEKLLSHDKLTNAFSNKTGLVKII